MSTLRTATPAVNPFPLKPTRLEHDRKITVLALLDSGEGIIRIVQDRKPSTYFVAPFASDYGAAFKLEKWGAGPSEIVETYFVNLHGDESTCDCKGHERY